MRYCRYKRVASAYGARGKATRDTESPLDGCASQQSWRMVACAPCDLESAYGRTPFFEYYIDRFLPFMSPGAMDRFQTIAELDIAIDMEIRSMLLLETDVEYGAFPSSEISSNMLADGTFIPPEEVYKPYCQVRGKRQGFIPGMSVLDLIFNLGPEAPLYLSDMIGCMRI